MALELTASEMDSLFSHYSGNCFDCERCSFYARISSGERGAVEAYVRFMREEHGRKVKTREVRGREASTGAEPTPRASAELLDALEAMLRQSGRPFVIVTDPATDRFVQYAGSSEESLLLDVPNLTPSEEAAATRRWPAASVVEGPARYFQMRFGRDASAAAAAGLTLLHEIIGVDHEAPLRIERGE